MRTYHWFGAERSVLKFTGTFDALDHAEARTAARQIMLRYGCDRLTLWLGEDRVDTLRQSQASIPALPTGGARIIAGAARRGHGNY